MGPICSCSHSRCESCCYCNDCISLTSPYCLAPSIPRSRDLCCVVRCFCQRSSPASHRVSNPPRMSVPPPPPRAHFHSIRRQCRDLFRPTRHLRKFLCPLPVPLAASFRAHNPTGYPRFCPCSLSVGRNLVASLLLWPCFSRVCAVSLSARSALLLLRASHHSIQIRCLAGMSPLTFVLLDAR